MDIRGGIVGVIFLGVMASSPAIGAEQLSPHEPQAGAASIWTRETLTGDWAGLRVALKDKGTDIALDYVAEGFRVASGGLRRRGSYEGRFALSVDSDLEKALGLRGTTAHVTVFNIHDGGSNVAQHVGSIADPSNIDARSTTRLYSAWLEQSLWDDRLSLRAGQLAADEEFFASSTAGNLINGTFGWPGLLAADMKSGGPAYPLATPGIRVKVRPTERLSVLGAVFNGDPAGRHCDGDPQRCNRHGTRFALGGGALWMGELQYGVNQSGGDSELQGIYKLGAWVSDGRFADQRFGRDASGQVVALSDPAFDGPLNHRGNWGVYGVADQEVWSAGNRSVSVFLRGGFSPANRNLISYYADAGVGLKGPLAGRPDDRLTLGVAYAKISRNAAAADRDAALFSDASHAVRSSEVVFELNYTAQITPWWTLQPDMQYIVRSCGGLNPDDPSRSLGHAFIVGLRTTIAF